MFETAPYHADVAANPAGSCYWLDTEDGTRIRLGIWHKPDAQGTVVIFPGRTEYIEKYGRAAQEFAQRGFACVAIDWRGQGLADRLLPNRSVGHVEEFTDYQHDVAVVMQALADMDLPQPLHLLGHSMGGCIGLRALLDGLPVASAMFSAPMWGIKMAPALRPVAWGLSSISRQLGFSGVFAPGQQAETYVLRAEPAGNTLTSDTNCFHILQQQLRQQPDLALGGPSLHWLNEALREMRALSEQDTPSIPTLTFLGSDEDIVDPAQIHARMNRWPAGELVVLENGRHEVLMETPAIRDHVFDRSAAHFAAHGG